MENNLKYIVYLTTNLVNNKIYIGVHQTKDPNTFDGYLGCGVWINRPSSYEHPKTVFQYAIKKYGKKNFKRKVLKIYDKAEDAYLLEEEIVNKNFLARDDVYNTALGGTNGAYLLTCKKIYQYNLNGDFIKEWESYMQVARYFNRSLITIQRCVKNKTIFQEFYFSLVKYDKLDVSKMTKKKEIPKIPVFQYSEKGEYECCYESINDAARVLNKNHSNIANAIKLHTLCYNKYFTNVFSPNYAIAKKEIISSKEIHQYDLDGNYIQSFKNMAEAKKQLKIKSDIYKAIKLNRLCGGYQWRFEKLDHISKAQSKSGRPRQVGQYDLNMNLIKIYPSKAQCEKENGKGISHVLYGRDKTHKNKIYKYLS